MGTLKRQFLDALKREGKSVTTYYNRDIVPCFFRTNEDGNNPTDRIRIFYDKSAPIKQGQIIEYRGNRYIVLNQETAENDTYYKSSIVQTNAELKWKVNDVIYKMPCYAGDLNSPLPTSGTYFSAINGNIEIITEDVERSRLLNINALLETMGGVYKVVNYLYKTGFTYVYIERTEGELTPPVYAVNILGDSEYDIVEVQTGILTVETTIDGEPSENPTIEWASSDESVATISGGELTFLSVGTTTITATWVEGNVSNTFNITVITSQVDVFLATISGKTTLYKNKTGEVYSVAFTNNGEPITKESFFWLTADDGVTALPSTTAEITSQSPVANTCTIKTGNPSGTVYMRVFAKSTDDVIVSEGFRVTIKSII